MTAAASATVDWFQEVASAAGHVGTATWTTQFHGEHGDRHHHGRNQLVERLRLDIQFNS